ncbi:hypothetical protein HDV05_006623, partial [Chytridiales sp. JEL 0842]
KLLIDPAFSSNTLASYDISSDEEEYSGQSSLESPSKAHGHDFKTGQFSCPAVFQKSFLLHPRLRPAQVLSSMAVHLSSLSISNRHNMFVFAARESIFYLRVWIDERETPVETTAVLEKQNSAEENLGPLPFNPISQSSPVAPSSPGPKRSTPQSALVNPLSTLPAPPAKTAEYFFAFEFYGVESPGREITVDFVAMVESKLAGQTQNAIGSFLSRNLSSRLSKADVDFLIPSDRDVPIPPTRSERRSLPAHIGNAFLFLLLLRQSLLGGNLQVLSSPDVGPVLRKHYESHYGIDSFNLTERCISPRAPSSFESAIGSGMAAICLSFISPRGTIQLDIPNEQHNMAQNSDTFLQILSGHRHESFASSNLQLLIEVWAHGSINLDSLMEFFEKHFNDTMLDYHLDCAVRCMSTSLSKGPTIATVFDGDDVFNPDKSKSHQLSESVDDGPDHVWKVDDAFRVFLDTSIPLLKASSDLKNPSVQELSSPVKLPSWIIDEFASEIHDILQEDSTLLGPVTVKERISELQPRSDLANHRAQFEVLNPMVQLDNDEDLVGSLTSSNRADKIIILAGIKAFSNRYGIWKPSSLLGRDPDLRKNSIDSDSSGMSTPVPSSVHNRWPSVEDVLGDGIPGMARKLSRKLTTSSFQPQFARSAMDEYMLHPGYLHTGQLDFGSRSCYVLLAIENNRVSVYTYNWNRSRCESLFNQVLRNLSWNTIRMQFLERQGPKLGIRESEDIRKRISPSYHNAISYSTSYGGLGGFGLATQHIGRRQGISTTDDLNPGDSQQFKKMYNMGADPLQSNAVEFLNWYVKQLRIPSSKVDARTPDTAKIRTRQHAANVSAGLRDKDELIHSTDSLDRSFDKINERPLTVTEMASALRSVRLHFSRYPIFFLDQYHDIHSNMNDISEDLTTGHSEKPSAVVSTLSPSITGNEFHAEEVRASWARELGVSYVHDYQLYLRQIGLETVDSSGLGSFRPSIDLSLSTSSATEPPVTEYLLQRVSAGTLIVQVGVDGAFASANLYMLRMPSASTEFYDDDNEEPRRFGAETEVDKEFKAKCAELKISYDFHVRTFLRIMNSPLDFEALDVLPVLKAFAKSNKQRPAFARSRLLHFESSIEDPSLSASLFQYILKNPQRYGFTPLLHDGTPTACFLTSAFPDFVASKDDTTFEMGPLSYTIVLYTGADRDESLTPFAPALSSTFSRSAAVGHAPRRASDGRVTLRYFLLVVDQQNKFPIEKLESRSQSYLGDGFNEVLKEYISEGCYLDDVKKFAESRIKLL